MQQLPCVRANMGQQPTRPRWARASTISAGCRALVLLLACLATPAKAGRVRGASSALFGQQPTWMQQLSADIPLDLSKADPHYATRGLPLNMTIRGQNIKTEYHMGYSYGNTALVRHGARYVMMVRKSHWSGVKQHALPWYPGVSHPKGYILFWDNDVLICSVDPASLQPIACEDFDPRTWEECWWGLGFEGRGVEDPRLFVWPGKGLFAMFGSKPWSKDPSANSFSGLQCEGSLAFQQWLVLLEPFATGAAAGARDEASEDPWARGVIRLSYPGSPNNTGSDGLQREKNWNPFVYRNKLFFSQSFDPHVVLKARPDGTCSKVYQTRSSVFRDMGSPRGNTQAVLVPAAFSGEPIDYYLGIVHMETNRSYVNHFYKMQARPPFKIYALSHPIPLFGGENPWNKRWKDVSFPMSLDLIPEAAQVIIGYGSGDRVPRVRTMRWQVVKALFPNKPREELLELLDESQGAI